MQRLSLKLVVVLAVVLLGWPAHARKRTVVVLDFGGGDAGAQVRRKLVSALRRGYRILPGRVLLDACDRIGVQMALGRPLARCAREVGAVAVVGGKIGGNAVQIAVYSGKTGRPLASGSVRRLSTALRLIKRGLRRAPRRVKKPKRPKDDPGLTFEPDKINRSDDPKPPPSDDPLAVDDPSENPLATNRPKPDATVKKKKKDAEGPQDPKVWGTIGVGTWLRTFSINQPAIPADDVNYSSGGTFAMRFMLQVRPVAFFLDGWAADFYLRLRYQLTLGLKSNLTTGGAEPLGTSISQFVFDAGYNYNILGKYDSPRVGLGLGGGVLGFSIDWPDTEDKALPDASYGFFLLGLNASYPFLPFLGAHLRFDYRVVSGAGEVEAEFGPGYGPASVGGVAFTLGLSGNFMKIIATVEYTYTRFFYTFNDAVDRSAGGDDKPAAAGALDQMHALLLNVGYSY